MAQIVTIDDVRKAGFCVAGARRWFALHGIDFRAFLVNGVSADRLRQAGDVLAEKAISAAEERTHG